MAAAGRIALKVGMITGVIGALLIPLPGPGYAVLTVGAAIALTGLAVRFVGRET